MNTRTCIISANTRITEQGSLTHSCIQALTASGCIVETVILGGIRPVIWILADENAKKIPHAIYMREKRNGQVFCTWVAHMGGCQVRWKGAQPGTIPTNVHRLQPAGSAGVTA